MPRVFVSYRRADSISITGRIYDRLVMAFGKKNVFKDVDDIPMGVDFRRVIENEISNCEVVLVIIGNKWHSIEDDSQQVRLQNPDDFVRLEVEVALAADVNIIPVLVSSADMPAKHLLPSSLHSITYLNSAIVREDPDFSHDIERLVRVIRDYRKSKVKTSTEPLIGLHRWHVGLVLALFCIYLSIFLVLNRPTELSQLAVGDVVTEDIFASEAIIYQSDIFAEDAEATAIASVSTIYTVPDLDIARTQLQSLERVLEAIDTIRSDATLSIEERENRLSTLEMLSLSEVSITTILQLSEEAWADMSSAARIALSNSLRGSVRSDNLEGIMQRLRLQVSPRLSSAATLVVIDIITEFIIPNTFVDEEATALARKNALANMELPMRAINTGSLIRAEGERLTPLDYEALQQINSSQTSLGDLIIIAMPQTILWTLMTVFWVLLATLLYKRVRKN